MEAHSLVRNVWWAASKAPTHAAVAGDIAWVTGCGQNKGTFNGLPIEADEYITDIYRRVDGEWLCMLTHLTPVHKGDK